MNNSRFIEGIRELAGATTLFPGKKTEIVLVINPRAGCFTHRSRSRKALADLDAAIANAAGKPRPLADAPFRSMETVAPRHSTEIAEALLSEAATKVDTEFLVILACGDGTSLEFLEALARSPGPGRDRFTVLRLPMGTGNDGSDGRELSDSLARLCGEGRIERQAAVAFRTNPSGPAAAHGPYYAFNIASVGLDAFVTNMTNKLKSALPGDSYKLWLDVSSLLYDRLYPLHDMTIDSVAMDGGALPPVSGRFLLVAMGVSGKRAYGSNKPILPDDDNVCAIRGMGFLRKILLKGPISSGRHRGLPEALLFSARRIEIGYHDRILAQFDGEAIALEGADFPVVMELTEPFVRHVARA